MRARTNPNLIHESGLHLFLLEVIFRIKGVKFFSTFLIPIIIN